MTSILQWMLKKQHGIIEYKAKILDERKKEYLLDLSFTGCDDLTKFLGAMPGNKTKNMRYYIQDGKIHLLAFWLYSKGGKDFNLREAFDKLNECYQEISKVLGSTKIPLNPDTVNGLMCCRRIGPGSKYYCGQNYQVSYTYKYNTDDFDIFSADWDNLITGVRCVCSHRHVLI